MTTLRKDDQVFTFTESQLQTLARNALMVAGQEMGEDGDHWPVIKQTITDLMRDWENLRIEREVHAEMKRHLYEKLAAMEQIALTCTVEEQKEIAPLLKELREVYDAHFTDVQKEIVIGDDFEASFEDKPLHIRRAKAILDTLKENEDD